MRSECSRFTLYTRGGGGLLLPSLPSFFRSPFFLSFLSSCCRISGKRCRASVVHRHRSIVGITNWTERMKFAGCEIGQIFKEQLKRRFFFFFFSFVRYICSRKSVDIENETRCIYSNRSLLRLYQYDFKSKWKKILNNK